MQCYFEGGSKSAQVFNLGDLTFGHLVNGPAIIVDDNRYIQQSSEHSEPSEQPIFLFVFSKFPTARNITHTRTSTPLCSLAIMSYVQLVYESALLVLWSLLTTFTT